MGLRVIHDRDAGRRNVTPLLELAFQQDEIDSNDERKTGAALKKLHEWIQTWANGK